MKGQVGLSMNYIFVLMASLAFLIMFFFLIKGCTEDGTTRVEALGTAAATSRLQSLVFQGDTTANLSLQPSLVTCPGGTLTLRTDRASNSIDRTPVFLPPEISGMTTVRTQEVLLGAETESPIPIGSVLYALDSNTYYLLVQDSQGNIQDVKKHLPQTQNVKIISSLNLNDPERLRVPKSADTLVIAHVGSEVNLANRAIPDAPERVLGVRLEPQTADVGIVTFYERDGEVLVQTKQEKYFTDYLGAGAVVTGTPENYVCGREAFGFRMRTLTQIYEQRGSYIKAQPGLPLYCRDAYNVALDSIFVPAHSATNVEDYMTSLFSNSNLLVRQQLTLLDSSCPVIA